MQVQAINTYTNFYTKKNNKSFGCKTMPKQIVSEAVSNSYKQQIQAFIQNSTDVLKGLFGIKQAKVNFPGVSRSNLVLKDAYPIALPHLLLIRPNNQILSLAEVSKNKSFQNGLTQIKSYLKKMYPNQDILFFEHGSGTITKNGEEFIQSAGKSVMFAHGHFCVLPKSSKGIYPQIVSELENTLTQNNWSDLAHNTHTTKSLIPQFEDISQKHKIKKEDFPPYILCSCINAKSKGELSTIFLQHSNKTKQAQTPSQLLRKIISKYVFNSSDETNWNWKTLFQKYKSGQDISEYTPHFNLLKASDDEFEFNLKSRRR